MLRVGNAASMPFFTDESFQAVVTSPPYWGHRDYGHGLQQLGFERRPAEFALNLATAFRETWRVLRRDGVLWVVIGDTYNTRTPIPSLGAPGWSGSRKRVDEALLGRAGGAGPNARFVAGRLEAQGQGPRGYSVAFRARDD
jgi:hypothetical protein